MQMRQHISIFFIAACCCFAGLVEADVMSRSGASFAGKTVQDEEWVTIRPFSPKHADRFAALLAKESIDFTGSYKSRLIQFYVRRKDHPRAMELFLQALKKEIPVQK